VGVAALAHKDFVTLLVTPLIALRQSTFGALSNRCGDLVVSEWSSALSNTTTGLVIVGVEQARSSEFQGWLRCNSGRVRSVIYDEAHQAGLDVGYRATLRCIY